MTTDAEREAFEAWAEDFRPFWTASAVNSAWDAWKASAALPPPQPEPVADDLVERLLHSAWGSNVADTLQSWTRQREEAAARITSDAATIEAKDARIAELEGDYEALADTVGKLGEDLAGAKTARNKLQDAVKRKDKALRAAIEALEEYNECAAYLNPIRDALNTGEIDAG